MFSGYFSIHCKSVGGFTSSSGILKCGKQSTCCLNVSDYCDAMRKQLGSQDQIYQSEMGDCLPKVQSSEADSTQFPRLP